MKQLTPVEALRILTGAFNPDHATTIIALTNLLARKLDKDPMLTDSFLNEQFAKVGIEIIDNVVQLDESLSIDSILRRQIGNKFLISYLDQEKNCHSFIGKMDDMELCFILDTLNERRKG